MFDTLPGSVRLIACYGLCPTMPLANAAMLFTEPGEQLRRNSGAALSFSNPDGQWRNTYSMADSSFPITSLFGDAAMPWNVLMIRTRSAAS